MSKANEYGYALRLARQDRTAVSKVAKETGQSINTVLVLSIRKGLPLARTALSAPLPRVTGVDPLPDEVLRRAYEQADESETVSAKELFKFQSQRTPE